MGKMISGLFGGGDDSAMKAQQAAAERRQLSDLARQQASVDMQGAAGGKKKGRSLLTYMSGDGQSTLG